MPPISSVNRSSTRRQVLLARKVRVAPASGNSGSANANPMTYTYTSKSGKQFVGIVAGGNLRVFAFP